MQKARRTKSVPAALEGDAFSRALQFLDEEDDDDLQLTETNAPPPARLEERQDDLENRQRETHRRSFASQESRKSSTSRDVELNEVAAPSPVQTPRRGSEDAVTLSKEQETTQPQRPTPRRTKWATWLYINSWLIWFSLLGTLARLSVEAITLYPNSPFPSRVLWANVGGSFIMGYLLQDRQLFREEWGSPDPKAPEEAHTKIKKTIPLFIGLSTGFCGSFTSFSSYIRDAFLAMSNNLESPSSVTPWHSESQIQSRNGGFSFLALVAILIVHPALSIAALQVGAHFALLLQPITPAIPFRFIRRILDPVSVLLGIGGWFAAIILTVYPPGNVIIWRNVTMSLIFAPLGCLLRYYVSKHTNGRIPSFPLGTFIVNVFGTMVIGMVFDLQRAWNIGASPDMGTDICSLLEGVSEGFCGCLTTVSTWVAELVSLRRRHAWTYGAVSIGCALASSVLIIGPFVWTGSLNRPTC